MAEKRVARSGSPEEFLDRGGVIGSGGATVMGRATYEESIGYRDGKPISVTARFDQGEWWLQKSGAWIRIADMSPGHRYNTAAMLMRAADVHAFKYAFEFAGVVDRHDGGEMAHDALEDLADEINKQTINDPEGWLRETTLYKALTAGLTIHGRGEASWQANGRDPVTGEPCEVPPPVTRVCPLDDCGCSGEAHA